MTKVTGMHFPGQSLRYEMCTGAHKPDIAYEWSLFEPQSFGGGARFHYQMYATKLARPKREHEMRWMGENDYDIFFDKREIKRKTEEVETEEAQRRIEKDIQQNYTTAAGTLNIRADTGTLGRFHPNDVDDGVSFEN